MSGPRRIRLSAAEKTSLLARSATAVEPEPVHPRGDGGDVDAVPHEPGAPLRFDARPGTGPKGFDFATLPEVRQVSLKTTAAELLGVGNPFFRAHDVRAGARTEIAGRPCLNFASYDYCAINGEPAVSAAAKAAIDGFGTSVSASRVVSGERPVHAALEAALAGFLGVESALVLVSGHATNVTTIGHLLSPADLVLTDRLAHNSITEGARLSGATRIAFEHNDLASLEAHLAAQRHRHRRALIAVEGLYSMDGDSPDLSGLIRLKDAYDAWLLVDEAHALGVLGASGRGIAEAQGVDPERVEIWVGTLSKALAGCGGFVAGSRALVDYLRATAPGFVFSVGLPAPTAAACLAALGVLEAEPERVHRCRAMGARLKARALARGLDVGTSAGHGIVPVVVGDSLQAVAASNLLLERGVNVLPIIFPAVPEGSARLRFFVTAAHTEDEIDRAVDLTAEAVAEVRATLSLGDIAGLARTILAAP